MVIRGVEMLVSVCWHTRVGEIMKGVATKHVTKRWIEWWKVCCGFLTAVTYPAPANKISKDYPGPRHRLYP